MFGILYWISSPIQQIIKSIRPFQEGKVKHLPKIQFERSNDEFSRLAKTINSLSEKVQKQILRL